MWLLVSVSQPDLKFVIVGDHQYVVGRQNCDIVIPDASVSRKQAILTMAHYESNVAKSFISPTLTLEDVSKFGTFVNGKQVKNPGGNTITLKHNDEIKFGGAQASIFRAVYESFIATTSCLEKAPKKCLHKVMCLLGGHVVRDWRPTCDLLIMSNINVTIKVICAINNQKHIVTPKYLDDLYSYHRKQTEKPNPVDYLPKVVDQEVPQGVSFHPNAKRATLLEGLKFYFLSAIQFNKTNLAVSTAGGQPILLEDGTEEDADTMTQDCTVVVAVTRDILVTLSPSCQKFVKLVYSTLKRKSLRMVTDPEIGWSILTCNTEDFCNPRSPITPSMLSAMASQSLSQMTEMDSSRDTQLNDNRSSKRLSATSGDIGNTLKEFCESQVMKVKSDLLSQGCSSDASTDKGTTKRINNDVNNSPLLEKKNKDVTLEDKLSDNVNRMKSDSDSIEEAQTVLNIEDKFKSLKSPVTHGGEKSNNIRLNLIREPSPPNDMGNVFALQKTKKNNKVKKVSRDDSDDDSFDCKTNRQKRKPLFVDDDEECNISKTRKKEDVFKEESDDAYKTLMKDNVCKEKTDDNSKTLKEYDTIKGKEGEVTFKEKKVDNDFGNQEAIDNDVSELFYDPLVQEEIHTPSRWELSSHPTVVSEGWINKKVKACDSDIKLDVKPDPELLCDKEGNLLRNMCEVQVVELVSHQPRKSKLPAAPSEAGVKNFKKFRKTENIGSKKLPTIIGRRDLEVYLSSKHKEIEDMFSNELALENERGREEKRTRDYFNWDDEPKKPVSRKAR
ncbi:nibrin [Biomphalaria pfeifferi]|uniref:Nibrin n=1 Tax=Biomphalaria pfeifferi TaxID=112525 RepID=A0AAD8B0K6_BIOPF|nr:nibrin [Biomphalaria pfeifferi]